MPLNQESASSFIERAMGNIANIKDGVIDFKDGVGDAIKAIGELAKIIIKGIDWIATMIANPVIILTFVDRMSIVIIMVLIILKMLGFEKLDKWIWLLLIIKVITCVLL